MENKTSWSFPWGWLVAMSIVTAVAFSYAIFGSLHAPSWLYDGFTCSVVAFAVTFLVWWITSGSNKVDDAIQNSHHSKQKYY